MNKWASSMTLGAMMLVWAGPVTAVPPAEKCEAAKNKIAGKYAFCRQKAEADAVKTGDPVDYSKCDAKYLAKWLSVETKGAGTCPTDGDAAAMRAFITQHTDDVAAALAGGGFPMGCRLPATGQTSAYGTYGTGSDGAVQAGLTLSYSDNGDGTITDNNTGLMWEKKDDSGGVHDKDNTYTWCGASCGGGFYQMDGTITTTFLATLNGGFAGYTDWRIPNARELQSIVTYEWAGHPIDSAFNQATCPGCTDVSATTCSCTQAGNYWSSTTYGNRLCQSCWLFAWFVSFGDGSMNIDAKGAAFHVRAVRGGV